MAARRSDRVELFSAKPFRALSRSNDDVLAFATFSPPSISGIFVSKKKKPKIIELNMGHLEDTLRRIEEKLDEKDFATLQTLVDAYGYLSELIGEKNTSMARLRKLLFGNKTEKMSAVLGNSQASTVDPAVATASEDASAEGEETSGTVENSGKAKAKGHGRNGADQYTGAEKIDVSHPTIQPGDTCPECKEGTVYETNRPSVVVRLVGSPPVSGKVYHLQTLRCGFCGKTFTAPLPEAAGEEKYDVTVPVTIALLKYGCGMPFNREQRLQGMLGVPLPASTQWGIVRTLAEHVEPVYEKLIRESAQGDVLYNDDTPARVLESMGLRAQKRLLAQQIAVTESLAETAVADKKTGKKKNGKKKAKDRKGLFTSGIVSATHEGRQIALFFTGHKHAGENLTDVLSHRAAELDAPIQMCDALPQNIPAELETILANCLTHGRRKFVDVVDIFPEECRHVLESLAVIYKNDADSRELKHSPQERLKHHQTKSGPVMAELKTWLTRQLDDRLVERNSSLGKSVKYLLNHWNPLTLFLRVAGAPLDNNICERMLKMAILHRKNAMFYKTHRGAHVGDLFMSLIHTCELGKVNPFDYLLELERHATAVAANPQDWLPWTYQTTLGEAPAT